MEKIKSNLAHVICAGFGLLNFIFFALPYLSKFASGYGQSIVERVSGYWLLGNIWETDFLGIMSGIIQILVLIASIGLLAWGVLSLLKALGIFEAFPNKVGPFEAKKISTLAVLGYAALNVLFFIFLVLFSITNSESGYGISYGFRPSFGVVIVLLLIIGAVVALFLLEKKGILGEGSGFSSDAVSYTYTCKNCGKKAKATDKFCSVCGGEIEKKQVFKEEYVCAACGKKAKAADKFCNICGGVIEKRIVVKKEYVCENCGKKAKATDKFCSVCGGAIKEQEIAPVQAENTVQD